MIEYSFEHVGRRNLDDELIFVVKFYWYSATQSIVEWIKQGMTIPQKEFSRLLFCSMSKPLKKYYHIEKEGEKMVDRLLYLYFTSIFYSFCKQKRAIKSRSISSNSTALAVYTFNFVNTVTTN